MSISSEFTNIPTQKMIDEFQSNDSKYKKIVIVGGVLAGVAIVTALAVAIVALTILSAPFAAPALAVIGVVGANVLIGVSTGIAGLGFISSLTMGFAHRFRKHAMLEAVNKSIDRLRDLDDKISLPYRAKNIPEGMNEHEIKFRLDKFLQKSYVNIDSLNKYLYDDDLDRARSTTISHIRENTDLYNDLVKIVNAN